MKRIWGYILEKPIAKLAFCTVPLFLSYLFITIFPENFLYINVSSSIPLGIYYLDKDKQPTVGDFVTFRLPGDIVARYAGKSYASADYLRVKEVVASGGDSVCLTASKIIINERKSISIEPTTKIPPQKIVDDCFEVQPGNVLPLGLNHPNSFDGRYYGPIPTSSLLGVSIPLLTF